MSKEGEEHLVAKIAQKVIIKEGDKVLIVRHPRSDTWELPGGRLNKGELPDEGLMREIKEELGADILPQGVVRVSSFLHQSEGEHITIIYHATLADPAQEFVLEKEEVAEIKWVTAHDLDGQPIWSDNKEALEIFFNLREK